MPQEFAARLRDVLNLPETLRVVAQDDPIVAPPIHGGWQTARHSWIDEQEPERVARTQPRSPPSRGSRPGVSPWSKISRSN